ncbi:MAG TPA: calcium-binding protein, partial [Mycoplana sp.]|nr:calcium-binding protein [Mycoplana sp.]
LLDGGSGADTLNGEAGNDSYIVDNAGDKVVEAANGGTDTVQASRSYTLPENVEKLILIAAGNYSGTGNVQSNTITGNGGANTLKGLGGNDVLLGGRGNDRLYGDSGNDKLNGAAGADTLFGGSGADTFVFRAVSDSTVASTGRDTIVDFSKAAGDRIDLSAIDARPASSADNAFVFIGKSAFTKCAGELRYQKSGSDTLILGDTNGDGRADFSILVSGSVAFAKGDFLL